MNDYLIGKLEDLSSYKWFGKVTRVVGLTIEAKGPKASVGELCYILVGKGNQK
ncbi:flagellum-specific ATP synthase FliI [Bacillus sp. TS-2]|nr:flagellum-specific ATP synthase FliI [Bacillus sp. TS-2]